MFPRTRPRHSEICVCWLLMGSGELWSFCCVHWPTLPPCSLIPTHITLITHSPKAVSIKHEDTNPISAKAATVHGAMFTVALLSAWKMSAWSSETRIALRDDIHPLQSLGPQHSLCSISQWLWFRGQFLTGDHTAAVVTPAPSAPLMGHSHTWPHRHAFIQKISFQ